MCCCRMRRGSQAEAKHDSEWAMRNHCTRLVHRSPRCGTPSSSSPTARCSSRTTSCPSSCARILETRLSLRLLTSAGTSTYRHVRTYMRRLCMNTPPADVLQRHDTCVPRCVFISTRPQHGSPDVHHRHTGADMCISTCTQVCAMTSIHVCRLVCTYVHRHVGSANGDVEDFYHIFVAAVRARARARECIRLLASCSSIRTRRAAAPCTPSDTPIRDIVKHVVMYFVRHICSPMLLCLYIASS